MAHCYPDEIGHNSTLYNVISLGIRYRSLHLLFIVSICLSSECSFLYFRLPYIAFSSNTNPSYREVLRPFLFFSFRHALRCVSLPSFVWVGLRWIVMY